MGLNTRANYKPLVSADVNRQTVSRNRGSSLSKTGKTGGSGMKDRKQRRNANMATFNEKDYLINLAEYGTNFWNVMRVNLYAADKI